MARNPVVAVRQLVRHRGKLCVPCQHLLHPLRSTSVQAISPSSPFTFPLKPFSKNFHFSKFSFLQYRPLSSSSGIYSLSVFAYAYGLSSKSQLLCLWTFFEVPIVSTPVGSVFTFQICNCCMTKCKERNKLDFNFLKYYWE